MTLPTGVVFEVDESSLKDGASIQKTVSLLSGLQPDLVELPRACPEIEDALCKCGLAYRVKSPGDGSRGD